MNHDIKDLLMNDGGNYILPFLWMHGEAPNEIIEEMKRIRECGIRAVCVEARPHPDFLGDRWWHDMDLIMDEARKYQMKVWLLDDEHFPTGIANFAYRDQYPEKAKYYLAERHMDMIGPEKNATFLIKPFLGQDGELISVIACPRVHGDTYELDLAQAVDLTDNVKSGLVRWDVPEGLWRLMVLYKTQLGGGREHYMNLISKESVQVLLDTIYKPHYERYKNDFGDTFAGFFSDEPELGNVPGYDFTEKLGVMGKKLPWSSELEQALKARWSKRNLLNLPALWFDGGQDTPQIRFQYMDEITKLVSSCFSEQVREWCEVHGVEYIGHLIEDDNAHARLGCSLGHYYRALSGQHMAGIDVVLLQIMPGFDQTIHQWIASDRDGEFFHYALAKLGSSHAHLDPIKKGRAMCEIFGAYGWAEDIALMKFLTDHMLIRGINHFVPHAFDPNTFPDRDCPPHFYAHNKNPQYRYFIRLMHYMNRMAHLLNNGRHLAQVAVLYHGEAEWADPNSMLTQKPVKALLQKQIDCDIVPADYLDQIEVDKNSNCFKINGESFACLVIPQCQYLPADTIEKLSNLSKQGVHIVFINEYPVDFSDRKAYQMETDYDAKKHAALLENLQNMHVCTLENLADFCIANKFAPVSLAISNSWIRVMFYQKKQHVHIMVMNEHAHAAYISDMTIDFSQLAPDFDMTIIDKIYQYDAYNNKIYQANAVRKNENMITINLQLDAGQSKLFVLSNEAAYQMLDENNVISEALISPDEKLGRMSLLASECKLIEDNQTTRTSTCEIMQADWLRDSQWTLLKATNEQYPVFGKHMPLEKQDWPNLNDDTVLPDFSGYFRYQTVLEIDKTALVGKRVFILLDLAKDGAEVHLNQKSCGMMIAKPYLFEITDALVAGKNDLIIDIANTLAWQVKDGQSTHMLWKFTGLRREPQLFCTKE